MVCRGSCGAHLVVLCMAASAASGFPFWGMIAFPVGCALALTGYYALLRLFSKQRLRVPESSEWRVVLTVIQILGREIKFTEDLHRLLCRQNAPSDVEPTLAVAYERDRVRLPR